MITYDKMGGRKIELFLPFEMEGGRKISEIILAPVKFDHTLNWRDGKYKTILALMSSLAGVEEKVLRELRYPDTDRVMAIFIDMLPPEIRETINEREQQQMPEGMTSLQEPTEAEKDMLHLNDEPAQPNGRDPVGLGVDLNG